MYNMPKLKLYATKILSSFLTLPGFKRYFANTSWLMAERIFRIAIAFTVGVYVIRYLGPERFGVLSYAISFASLISFIATLGLDEIAVRELVKDETKRDELLGTVFYLKLIGAFLVLAILYIAVHFTLNDGFTNLLIFIIAASTIFRSFGVINLYLQSKVLSKYTVYSQFASLTIASIIKLLLIWAQASLLYFVIVLLLEEIILAIGLLIVYINQRLDIFHWRVIPKLAVKLLKDSWPLMLSGVCVSIYMRIDQVMIKEMLNTEAVGQYSAAVRLSEVFYFIPMIVCASLFPAIINAKSRDQAIYHARLQRLYSLMAWMAVSIAVITMFVAKDAVMFLYGSEFAKASPVLTLHIWGSVFVFLGVASDQYLIAENYTRIMFVRTFIGMVVNIILNLILIPRYMINGAAIATVISYFIATFFILFIPKTHKQAVTMLKSFNLICLFRGEYKERWQYAYEKTGFTNIKGPDTQIFNS